uniref:DUF1618 domain-containing protein n=1 Tax=Oryza punctata TaxID=4537 RepID=A0A0E0JVG1_ORYPU
MIRRFLHLVDICYKPPLLSNTRNLRRIDPSHLFYPNDALPLDRPSPTAEEEAPLPPKTITFRPPGKPGSGTVMWMDVMRRNDDKIVTVDQNGRAILYDPGTHSVRALPAMITPKSWILSLAVGDDLYAMATIPRPDKDGSGKDRRSFEALIHCDERRPKGGMRKEGDDCFWRPLPPPPCVHAADYQGIGAGEICGYAAVGNSHILVSTMSYGTYSFDTASSEWRKAGDWTLPFRGHAEYVPEHGLWFGFSAADDGVLGAWDLSPAVQQQQQPPLVVHSGCNGFTVPDAHVSRALLFLYSD